MSGIDRPQPVAVLGGHASSNRTRVVTNRPSSWDNDHDHHWPGGRWPDPSGIDAEEPRVGRGLLNSVAGFGGHVYASAVQRPTRICSSHRRRHKCWSNHRYDPIWPPTKAIAL